MRWLMTLGENTRPDVPQYAECPSPEHARAVALVDDFGHLFPVLWEWSQIYGQHVTAWAMQVEADDIERLPADLVEGWEDNPDFVRLDRTPGGYVNVSDYRDQRTLKDIAARTNVLMRF
ncbi:hypothetical protein [Streptomyces malaysiensis]|uniref:hypothetical protein n=1 Tax=Streptomyces malaysiensis TaxID=92644 RepID=UPI0036869F1C